MEGYEGVAVVSEGSRGGTAPQRRGNFVLLVEGGVGPPPNCGILFGSAVNIDRR